MIYNNVLDLVGATPLLRMDEFFLSEANVFAKLEYFNPAGSIKDRVALNMIQELEEENKVNKDTLFIEATSGNTGIGLAMVCAVKGYKLVLTMPETMSIERRKFLSAYGARLELSDGSKGMAGAVELAKRLHKENPNSVILSQFDNLSNPRAHEKTTAPELIKDFDEAGIEPDILICGIGTGGTITGLAKSLKQRYSDIKVVGVEPETSPVITKGVGGSHGIQGIGAGFIPANLHLDLVDEVVCVSDDAAFKYMENAAKHAGLFVGISSGAVLAAADDLIKNNKNKNIILILADGGSRYLSIL